MLEIATERGYEKSPSWHTVFEWEDDFSKDLQAPLFFMKNSVIMRFKKMVWSKLGINIRFRYSPRKPKFGISMNAFYTDKHKVDGVIPYILDFHIDALEKVYQETLDLPCFFVSCLDIYNRMKALHPDAKCYFLPQCVSDRYLKDTVPTKSIDVIQYGRRNPVLHEYMLRYCQDNPEVTYVFLGESGYVKSDGKFFGEFETRDEFIRFIQSAKIALVSTPGADLEYSLKIGMRTFGEGIDFFTARFYECAASYCYMVGRYTENEEATRINIASVCDNVKNYDEFRGLLDIYLHNLSFTKYEAYRAFNKKNSSSVRAMEIKRVLQECNVL